MAKSTAFAEKLQGFTDQAKTEPVQLPPQKATLVQPADSLKEEQQLNVWIPKDLMKRLKVKGAEADRSLKEMVIKALSSYLEIAD